MTTPQCDRTTPTACFSVLARAEPGVLPRILELFAKRGLVLASLQAWQTGADELTVEIRMNGMEQPLAVYIGECLRAIFTVEQVLVSESRQADVA